MADTATRRRIASPKIADDGSSVEFTLWQPDVDGKYTAADTFTYETSSIPPDKLNWLALYGLSQIASARYNKLEDDVTPADTRTCLEDFTASVTAGTWSPGRQGFAEREPTDLEMAIAEATGTPIADLLERIENEVQLSPDGTPKLDARGRKMRVFTQRVLEALGEDPAVKPILARLVAERAKRLSAEAKRGGGTSALGKLFSAPAPEQQAAQ